VFPRHAIMLVDPWAGREDSAAVENVGAGDKWKTSLSHFYMLNKLFNFLQYYKIDLFIDKLLKT
jgi:hypothetical protein